MRTALLLVLAVGVVTPTAKESRSGISASPARQAAICRQLQIKESRLFAAYKATRATPLAKPAAGRLASGAGGSAGPMRAGASAQFRASITILPQGIAAAQQRTAAPAAQQRMAEPTAQPFRKFRRGQLSIRRAMKANGCEKAWDGRERRAIPRQVEANVNR